MSVAVQSVATLGGLLGALYVTSSLKETHNRVRVRAAEASRRAVDPINVDKGTGNSFSNTRPAPQYLKGSYAGLGKSARNVRDHHLQRNFIQAQSGKVHERLHRIRSQVGLGTSISNEKLKNLFGQGRAQVIGNDYKPVIAQMVGQSRVTAGHIAHYRRAQESHNACFKHDTDYSPLPTAKHHPFLGTRTINKAFHGQAPPPSTKSHHLRKARNYKEFVRMEGHSERYPHPHGRPSQKRSNHVYF